MGVCRSFSSARSGQHVAVRNEGPWAGSGWPGLALQTLFQSISQSVRSFYRVLKRFRRWAGLGWPGLAWAGLGWPGLAWAGLGWLGLAWSGLAWLGLGLPGPAWGA